MNIFSRNVWRKKPLKQEKKRTGFFVHDIGGTKKSIERGVESVRATLPTIKQWITASPFGSIRSAQEILRAACPPSKKRAWARSSRAVSVQGVLKVGGRPQQPGLWLLDSTPDPHWMRFGITNPNDNESLMALISCGCQIVFLVTGRGNVVGSAVAPVIKITGNSKTVFSTFTSSARLL